MAYFLIINGEIFPEQEAKLAPLSAETYIVSQKVWYGYGGIPLLQENISNIEQQLKSLGAQLPALFQNKREIFRLTKRMLNKNKFYRSGLINIQFIISDEGIDYQISAQAEKTFDFPLSEKGLLVEFSNDKLCAETRYSKLRCHHSNLWQIAKAQIKNKTLSGQILLNHNENLTEGINANLFMVKDGALVTPALSTGCYQDLLRPVVLEFAHKLNLKIIETNEIEKPHLLSMDEALFVSEEKGIQWILGIGTKRFVNETSLQLHEKLNDYLQEMVK